MDQPTRAARRRLRLPCRRAMLPALLGLAGLLPGLPAQGGDASHEQARAAVQSGEVLPLPVLLERLQRTHPGQVLELEFEHADGRWVYEVKLLQPDGQLLRLDVDARTGEVLKARQRDGDRRPQRPPGERGPR